jgi:dUTP pyrophosphatase
MDSIKIKVVILPHGEGLELPTYQTAGSAGMDLRAAIEGSMMIEPGERRTIPAGIKIAVPYGYEAQIRSRSGTAVRSGLIIINSPGTIDSDYRGEVQMAVINLSRGLFFVNRGDRLAQMVIAPVTRGVWEPVPELDNTERGGGSLGSTGMS